MSRRVVNLHSHRPYDEYIGRGRGSEWGNPFIIGVHGDRKEVIDRYRSWILDCPELLARLYTLHNRTLGCWCAPQACHGDVLVEFAKMSYFVYEEVHAALDALLIPLDPDWESLLETY